MNQEQWKELCEWAGFYQKMDSGNALDRPCLMWRNKHSYYFTHNLPPQDMNTLWCWMWPKLDTKQRLHVIDIWMPLLVVGKDPLEALVQAIYQVAKNESI